MTSFNNSDSDCANEGRYRKINWIPYLSIIGFPSSPSSSSSSSGYRSEIQNWNVTLTTVRLGQDSHLSRVCTVKGSNIFMIKLCTPVACYAVDGGWTAIEAWRAVLKASIF